MEDYDMTMALLGVGSAALVVTIYHCIAMVWCNGGRGSQSAEPTAPQVPIGPQEQPSSTEVSTAQHISTHKYQRNVGLEGEDEVCAVCLGEYEEGEEIRTLTECQHTYHAPCIDMWLFSHSNCPLCRTNTTPLLPVSPLPRRGPDSSSAGSQPVMLQGVIIHSVNLR